MREDAHPATKTAPAAPQASKTGNIRHAVGGRGKNAARCGENAVLHVAAGQGDIDFDVAGLGVGGGRQGDGRNAALRAAAKRDGCAGAQVLDRAGNGGVAKVNGIPARRTVTVIRCARRASVMNSAGMFMRRRGRVRSAV